MARLLRAQGYLMSGLGYYQSSVLSALMLRDDELRWEEREYFLNEVFKIVAPARYIESQKRKEEGKDANLGFDVVDHKGEESWVELDELLKSFDFSVLMPGEAEHSNFDYFGGALAKFLEGREHLMDPEE